MKMQRTLVELLRTWAQRDPDFLGYSWLGEDGNVVEAYSYAQLERRARAIAAELSTRARPGDRILLLHRPGLEFVAAFFGCLFAGLIAVPALPPSKPRDQRRIAGIAKSAAPVAVLGDSDVLEHAQALAGAAPALGAARWLVTSEIPLGLADGFRVPELRADAIALLQYTSGSTGDPKGVMVTHGNVIANQLTIQRGFYSARCSTCVGWLPHFHDMGLIGNILHPLSVGSRALLMSPAQLLRDPLRWLRAISKYQADLSGGPNFAYELCALRSDRFAESEALDLSSWRVAFVGAEPVRAATLERFAQSFARFGFQPRAFCPCYGLAEATLYVTGAQPGRGAKVARAPTAQDPSRELVSCGVAGHGQDVRIVNPITRVPCAPGEEGEIWVSGDSVAAGYWRRERDSVETFHARLASQRERSFLRTGDLGVMVDGELFVTGRAKDLIVVRGQNYHPQDIEPIVERAHPALRASASAAFSFADQGEERVVVVAEVARAKLAEPPEALARSVRLAVAQELELRLDLVVLVAVRTVPKTSSGKIARSAARADFLSGQLELVGFSTVVPLPDAAWARALRKVCDPPWRSPSCLERAGVYSAVEPNERGDGDIWQQWDTH